MGVNLNKWMLFLFCMVVFQTYAQIQPATSHYMFNPQIFNPAFYGKNEGINFGANYRHQWAALSGQPRTVNIFTDANIPRAHGGLGFNITNDMLGAFSLTNFNVGYAFIQDIKKKLKISIGLNAGATFSKLDGSRLITPQGSNGDLNDDILSNQIQRSIRPNLSFGISIIHKYIEAGLVYTNLINGKDKFAGINRTQKSNYGGVLQTYVGSKIRIKENFNVRPSILLTTDFRQFQTDISFMAGYKDYVALGFNVRGYNKRAFESLSPIISMGPIKNICLIYSYDVTLNKLNPVNNGSHEITLNYVLPNNKIYRNPKIINNPRFL